MNDGIRLFLIFACAIVAGIVVAKFVLKWIEARGWNLETKKQSPKRITGFSPL